MPPEDVRGVRTTNSELLVGTDREIRAGCSSSELHATAVVISLRARSKLELACLAASRFHHGFGRTFHVNLFHVPGHYRNEAERQSRDLQVQQDGVPVSASSTPDEARR